MQFEECLKRILQNVKTQPNIDYFRNKLNVKNIRSAYKCYGKSDEKLHALKLPKNCTQQQTHILTYQNIYILEQWIMMFKNKCTHLSVKDFRSV